MMLAVGRICNIETYESAIMEGGFCDLGGSTMGVCLLMEFLPGEVGITWA